MRDYPTLKVTFLKTHEDAKLPTSARETDTGYDLYSIANAVIPAKSSNVVPIGIQVADVPPNMWYLILPRSGLGFKHGIQPHLGVIDQSFRGDLSVKLYNFSDTDYTVSKGDRVAQIAFYPLIKPDVEWASEITETERGANKFGSTGR